MYQVYFNATAIATFEEFHGAMCWLIAKAAEYQPSTVKWVDLESFPVKAETIRTALKINNDVYRVRYVK